MFYNNIDPVLFSFGPFEVRYYGLIFLLGFIIAYFMIIYLAKERKIALKRQDIEDLVLYLAIGVIAGARVFEIVFYEPGYFFSNPLEMLKIWKGGLSFHGGLAGAVFAIAIFCKRKKIDFLEIADIIVIPASLGLVFGRIGNFLNSELVGKPTALPWGVDFKNEGIFRHPSQIYESLKNLLIFISLWSIRKKGFPKGFMFGVFVLMYSFIRFFIEFFKEPVPDFLIFGLTMGQILSGFMFIFGVIFLVYIKKTK